MRVVREWIDKLPLRMQSTMLLALRGPDGVAKENSAKVLCREMRFVILQPAFPMAKNGGTKDDGSKDDFMGTQTGYCSWNIVETFKENHDEYPHHWLMHFIHAAEIVGQHHPDDATRLFWYTFYTAMCSAMHMHPEDIGQLDRRLGYTKAEAVALHG